MPLRSGLHHQPKPEDFSEKRRRVTSESKFGLNRTIYTNICIAFVGAIPSRIVFYPDSRRVIGEADVGEDYEERGEITLNASKADDMVRTDSKGKGKARIAPGAYYILSKRIPQLC